MMATVRPLFSSRGREPQIIFGEKTMIFLRWAIIAISLFLAGTAIRANTLYISAAGNDNNNCTVPTTPCASIVYAINAANPNDTIICVGPVGTGAFALTKSIDIDCSAGRLVFRDGSISASPGSGALVINIPASDALGTVRLRGLSFMGARGPNKYVENGIYIEAAKTVQIEDVTISDMVHDGIIDARTTGQTRLSVTNATIRNNGGPGIVAAASGGSTAVVLDNVHLENNTYGLATAAGNTVTINRSIVSFNSIAGVEADGGSLVIVDGSTIANNNIGIQSGSAIRLSNNNIQFNTTGVNGATGTYGNNRFAGNGNDGTALSPIGGSSTDLAQK